MKIISHRGYWREAQEKNTTTAFHRSFALGYGTETDIRDCAGKIVISHDMPKGDEMLLDDFLQIVANYSKKNELCLAMNIKADGLAQAVKSAFLQVPGLQYFVFDMSVPDMFSYFALDIPVMTRLSEVEREPTCLELCTGIWLDAFHSEWYDMKMLEKLLLIGKTICIVSPGLHKRPHLAHWEKLKTFNHPNLMLCTDYLEEAINYFT